MESFQTTEADTGHCTESLPFQSASPERRVVGRMPPSSAKASFSADSSRGFIESDIFDYPETFIGSTGRGHPVHDYSLRHPEVTVRIPSEDTTDFGCQAASESSRLSLLSPRPTHQLLDKHTMDQRSTCSAAAIASVASCAGVRMCSRRRPAYAYYKGSICLG